jgi:hypothetical protein
MVNENTFISFPTSLLHDTALRRYIDAIKSRITEKRQSNDGINTPTSPPAASSLSSLSDSTTEEYTDFPKSTVPQKRQGDNEQETSTTKRRNTKDLPLPNNAHADAFPKPHSMSPVEKTSQRVGKGKKRQNESDDEGEERRVKPRVTVNEEATGDEPSDLRSLAQEYDEEYIETFGHQITLAEASTERGTPDDEDREMFQKAENEVGCIFLFLFLLIIYAFIYIVENNSDRLNRWRG